MGASAAPPATSPGAAGARSRSVLQTHTSPELLAQLSWLLAPACKARLGKLADGARNRRAMQDGKAGGWLQCLWRGRPRDGLLIESMQPQQTTHVHGLRVALNLKYTD